VPSGSPSRGSAAARASREPGRDGERPELARREIAPRAGGQRAEDERAQADARQLLHRVADGRADTADEVRPALVYRHLEPRLRRELLDDAHARGRGLPVLEPDAAAKARKDVLPGRAAHLHLVDARDGVTRMEERRGERPVVREKQEPGRVHVEPSDGIEPVRGADERGDRRTALGVAQRAHDAARLVEDDRPPRADADRVAVDRDPIDTWVRPPTQLAHDGAVHRDTAGADQVLRGAPGRDARGAQDLLEPLATHPARRVAEIRA